MADAEKPPEGEEPPKPEEDPVNGKEDEALTPSLAPEETPPDTKPPENEEEAAALEADKGAPDGQKPSGEPAGDDFVTDGKPSEPAPAPPVDEGEAGEDGEAGESRGELAFGGFEEHKPAEAKAVEKMDEETEAQNAAEEAEGRREEQENKEATPEEESEKANQAVEEEAKKPGEDPEEAKNSEEEAKNPDSEGTDEPNVAELTKDMSSEDKAVTKAKEATPVDTGNLLNPKAGGGIMGMLGSVTGESGATEEVPERLQQEIQLDQVVKETTKVVEHENHEMRSLVADASARAGGAAEGEEGAAGAKPAGKESQKAPGRVGEDGEAIDTQALLAESAQADRDDTEVAHEKQKVQLEKIARISDEAPILGGKSSLKEAWEVPFRADKLQFLPPIPKEVYQNMDDLERVARGVLGKFNVHLEAFAKIQENIEKTQTSSDKLARLNKALNELLETSGGVGHGIRSHAKRAEEAAENASGEPSVPAKLTGGASPAAPPPVDKDAVEMGGWEAKLGQFEQKHAKEKAAEAKKTASIEVERGEVLGADGGKFMRAKKTAMVSLDELSGREIGAKIGLGGKLGATRLPFNLITHAQFQPRKGFSVGIPPVFTSFAVEEVDPEEANKAEPRDTEQNIPSTGDRYKDFLIAAASTSNPEEGEKDLGENNQDATNDSSNCVMSTLGRVRDTFVCSLCEGFRSKSQREELGITEQCNTLDSNKTCTALIDMMYSKNGKQGCGPAWG